MKIEYWQHERSGEVWAVIEGAAIGPIYYEEKILPDDPRWNLEEAKEEYRWIIGEPCRLIEN